MWSGRSTGVSMKQWESESWNSTRGVNYVRSELQLPNHFPGFFKTERHIFNKCVGEFTKGILFVISDIRQSFPVSK